MGRSCHVAREGLEHMDSRTRNRYLMLRIALALGSLVALVLASGAGEHWH